MGKKKDELFAKAKELEKKIVYSEEDDVFVEPADRAESYKAIHVVSEIIDKTIQNVVTNVGIAHMVENASAFDMTKEKMADFILSCAQRINKFKTKSAEITQILESETYKGEKVKAVVAKYQESNDFKDFNEFVVNQIRNQKKIGTIDELDAFVDKVSASTLKETDEYMPQDITFENPVDNGLKNEICPIENEIKELRSEFANDLEMLKALDGAYYASLSGNPKTVDFQSKLAERMGKDALTFETRDDLNYIKKSNYDLKDFDIRAKSIIFSSEATPEKIAEYTRSAYNTFPSVDNDLKARFLNIEKYINDNGYGDKLDELSDYKPLDDARGKIKEAILSKNKAKIIEAVNEYNIVDHFYTSLLQYCNALTPDNRFPNNMSKARVATIPFKYRNDVKGNSFLRTITAMMKDTKEAGITIEDYLNDPAKSNLKIIKDFEAKQDERYSVKEMNIVDAINDMSNHSQSEYMIENSKFASIGHGLTFLHSAVYGEKQEEFRMKLNMIQRGYNDKRMVTLSALLGNKESLANLIGVEAEDRNLRDISTQTINYDSNLECKNFNLKNYFLSGKTSPSAVVLRIADIAEGLVKDENGNNKFNDEINTKVLEEACEENVKTILENPEIKISETARKILVSLNEGEELSISKTDKLILTKEAAINKAVSNESIKNTPNKTVNELADLKRDYARRNIFLKMFGPETRRLSRAISNLTESMVESGLEVEILNEKMGLALRGELENEKPVLEEVKEVKAPEVKKNIIMDLDEEDEPVYENIVQNESSKILDLDEDVIENNQR